jgi:L-threonylcarbamoyladenylate synthase
MEAKIVSKKYVDEVVNAFNEGKIIALPTETVFGLGVIYDSYEAYNNMIIAKNRPLNKAFPLVIGSLSQLDEVAIINEKQLRVIKHFFPGPLTVVVKKKPELAGYISANQETIAIRMPDDKFILDVLHKLNKPILLTSANKSGENPALNHVQAFEIFKDSIDLIVEGECKYNIASTIVSLVNDEPLILREGVIKLEDINKIFKGE